MPILTTTSPYLQPLDYDNLLSSEQAYVAALITVAEEYLQDRFWNRQIAAATYTDEKYDGTGEPQIFVKNLPLNSVTDIDIVATSFTGTSTTTTYAATKFDIQTNIGKIRFKPGSFLTECGGIFTHGFQNIHITYNGGFSPVPETIKLLIAKFVIHAYNPGLEEGLIEKEKLGEYFYSKAVELIQKFPFADKKLFDSYKIRRIPSY